MAGFLINVGKAGEVAERSPAVISANLKEDMLLEKKRTILNRSERSVVHQIKVDQKVLYKRFQSRLVRSKLAFARIMGQKDTEKALRSKNLTLLNTDIVGQSDEEYSFLHKLEHRPCTEPSPTPIVALTDKTSGIKAAQKRTKPDKILGSDARAVSARSILQRKSDSLGNVVDKQPPITQVRPATTTGLRLSTNMLLQNRLKTGAMSPIPEHIDSITEASVDNHVDKSETVDYNHTDDNGNDNDDTSQTSPCHEDNEQTRETFVNTMDAENDMSNITKLDIDFDEKLELNQIPQTVGYTHSYEDDSPLVSPILSSRRASRATDFFHEEKKIDLIALRLKDARSKDYNGKIQTFYESIENVVNDPNRPNIDYYASRLGACMTGRECMSLMEVPGTPEDENKRSIGNLLVRSLTVPVINLNYS